MLILKNSCSKFGSKAKESLCDDISNYCKLIWICRFSQSLRGVIWGTPSTNDSYKGELQISTTCFLLYLNTECNGLHLAIVIVLKLLSHPANYAYPRVYEQTPVYNCLSWMRVFINTKNHILCIQLHKIFQACGNM